MADMLPKIIEAAKKSGHVRVRCSRPTQMAKELRRHLPDFDITRTSESLVVIRRRPLVSLPGACSTGPTCVGRP